jgi:pseudouridine synthase
VTSTRLQKLLSAAGVASRREAERMIEQGRVTVNGAPAVLGQKVDPAKDRVKVDGAAVRPPRRPVYLLLHKPRGYVTTRADERGRPTVLDLVREKSRYLYPVGRLDMDSEGLLLLTTDGEVAHRLTHPRHQVSRTYRVLVDRPVTEELLDRLRRGIMLEDGMTRPAKVRLLARRRDGVWYQIVIREGRNRQVRRMFGAAGTSVRRLVRVGLGPLSLSGLPSGAYRPLTPEEVALLKERHDDRPVPAR